MTESAAVAQAARALLDSAKMHKRASAVHRRAARVCMQGFAQLAEACKALGIGLELKA